MDKEINKVFSTSDYSKFKFLSSNRDLRLSHIEELKESIRDRPLDKPIDVNEKMEIIDGQHRYYAWMELNMPVIYIIHKGWGAAEVPVLNTNQKNWNPSDFVKMYCDQGIDDYIKYKEFSERYGFTHQANMIILSGSRTKSSKDFSEGRFKVTKWVRANILAKQIIELKPYYDGYKRCSFVAAYLDLAADPKFDHGVFMNKISYQSRKIVDCTTTNQYYELLREIYNFKARAQDRILQVIEK